MAGFVLMDEGRRSGKEAKNTQDREQLCTEIPAFELVASERPDDPETGSGHAITCCRGNRVVVRSVSES